MIIEFDFLPPSVNKCYYTDFKSHTRHKSKDYRDFIRNLESYIPREQIDGEIEVEYNFYFPDKRKRDIANLEKALTDSLVHYGVIQDDSMIQRLVLEKYYDKGKPYTIIEIKKHLQNK